MNHRGAGAVMIAAVLLAACMLAFAQAPPGKTKTSGKQVQSRSSSTVSYGSKDGEETVEINNVAYEITNDFLPGRPRGSRLVLRTTTHSTQILGDKGVDASVTMEAWPLGSDLQKKPIYAIRVPGIGAQTVDGSLWVVDRSIDPDLNWWSVYMLGTGQHLFDTHVDLLRFSASREEVEQRYAGLEAPPDNTSDARLKDPRVVAILTYASAEKVIREALVACDDLERARDLRSYADSTRALFIPERPGDRPAIRISFSVNYPSAANQAVVSIPISGDDLDVTHAEAPKGFRVADFRR